MKSIKLKKTVMVAMASMLIFGGIAKVGFANEIDSNIIKCEAINQQEKNERLSFKEYMDEMKNCLKDIDESDLNSLEELYNEANEKWEAFDKILEKYYKDDFKTICPENETVIKGEVVDIENGKDGITAIISTEEGDYSVTISLVTTNFISGSLGDIKEGSKLEIKGLLWNEASKNMSAREVNLFGVKKQEDETKTSEINKYETVGEIIDFGKGEVHVITGDVAEIFKIDKEKMKDFYLGEIVGVKKIGENKYELEAYKDKDFSVRHTNMGQLISTVTGKLKEIKDNKFIISTKDGEMEFKAYEKLFLEKGTEVTVDYIEFQPGSGEKIFLDIYNESSKINLIVKNIRRAESGTMMLSTEDEKGLKYEVYVLGKSVLNFNHSDLKENDKITVYPEVIRESYPAQVDAKMIKKNK